MQYVTEKSLRDFDFWGGAQDNAASFTEEQLDQLESILENEYGPFSENDINDYFRFEEDFLAQLLGFEDFDALVEFNENAD